MSAQEPQQFASPDLSNSGNDPGIPPAEAHAPPVLSTFEFKSLDPRVVKHWRIVNTIVLAVPLGVLFVAGIVASAKEPGNIVWIAPGWCLLAGLAAFFNYWHPPRAYRAFGYRIDGRVFEIRSGIWFRVLRLLPLPRLQHVDLHRGPLERACGLASLVLHTAGTHEATLSVPGLDADEAARLRDQLLAAGGDDAV